MTISLDDLVDGLALTTKAAYAAAVAGCTSSYLRASGLCAPSSNSLPWPITILSAIALVWGALWLNNYLSRAWENELGVFGTPWVLKWRFGEPTLSPPSGPKHGSPEWWKEQVVVVTGGAGGLGWATARRVLKLGARAAVWDIVRPKALDEGKSGEGKLENGLSAAELERTTFVRCNVADREAVVSAAAEVRAKFGPVTILVNNAGIHSGLSKTIDQLTDQEVNRIFGINVLSHFWTLHALLPDMLATGSGHVVSIASIMGQMPIAHLADYVSTKHAIKGLHYTLRRELDSVHRTPFVRTTYVALGRMKTPLFKDIAYDARSEFFAPTLDHERVARDVVRALASGQSGAIRLPLHAKLLWVFEFAPSWLIDLVYALARVDSAMD